MHNDDDISISHKTPDDKRRIPCYGVCMEGLPHIIYTNSVYVFLAFLATFLGVSIWFDKQILLPSDFLVWSM